MPARREQRLRRWARATDTVGLISVRRPSLVCRNNEDGTSCLNNRNCFWTERDRVQENIYLTTCKDYRRAWGFGSVRDGHSLWWRLRRRRTKQTPESLHICNSANRAALVKRGCTSSITTQICFTHSMMDCGVPAMVMARSVELGNMSPATCTWAPADCKDSATWRSYTMADITHLNLLWAVRRNSPLWFPWFCSHLCQWVSHTDWQARRGEWWPVVCWWPYC